MGLHVESVYRIPSDDRRNLYIFVFGVPPWTPAYSWIEEHFLRISRALGTDGLLVMGDGIDSELNSIYFEVESEIQRLLTCADRGWSGMTRGFIVTNVNPHRANSEGNEDAFVYFLSLAIAGIEDIVTAIVETAKDGDRERLRRWNILDEGNARYYVETMQRSGLVEALTNSKGLDLVNLDRQLGDIQRERQDVYGGRPPLPALGRLSRVLLQSGFVYPKRRFDTRAEAPKLPLPEILASKKLRVFLCHGREDKQVVRDLYSMMKNVGLQPWLDEVDLPPGIEWEPAIRQEIRTCDVVLACLSNHSVSKEGFVQKEIRFALDRADEHPKGMVYIIPVLLEDCPIPEDLSRWQAVAVYETGGYDRLLTALSQILR